MDFTFDNSVKPATPDQWKEKLLGWARDLKLKTTSWHSGAITRTTFAVMSFAFASIDQIIANVNAGGFLEPAAAITPEGGPGALDYVAYFGFGVVRSPASFGSTTVKIVNTGVSVGPLPPGTYHFQCSVSKHTYKNKEALTIAPGNNLAVPFECEQIAVIDASGVTVTPVTSYAGVTIPDGLDSDAIGASAQSNSSLVAQCRNKLGALGPKIAKQSSLAYFATATNEPNYPLPDTPITRARAFADTISGAVTTVIANASGAPSGGDVAIMQTYLDGIATGDTDTNTVKAAPEEMIDFVIHVRCSSSFSAQLTSDVTDAIDVFCSLVEIGGDEVEEGFTGFSFNEFNAFLTRKLTYIRTYITTLNGGSVSLSMSSNQVPKPNSITVTRDGE